MAFTEIDRPDLYFNTKLYTGNGVETAITGVGFQPDWIWFKARSSAYYHGLFDVIRGTEQRLVTNTSDAESTKSSALTSFDSDGFTLGADVSNTTNASGQTFVAWNWLASNTTASNSDGSITSTVSANTTSGFSIVSYTGTGANATVGHGLGVVPSMIIVKNRDSATNWYCYHKSLGAGYEILLNSTNASDTTSQWNSTEPTSSVFSLGNSSFTNGSGNSIIAYCFAEKKGYSKFGSYTGNGNADGPFVYTGFRPAWLMIKQSSGAGNDWLIYDNKRDTSNVASTILLANGSGAEATGQSFNFIDLLSNGFKLRGSDARNNGSGGTMIYMAFAENPFVTSSAVPACAR